jgi:hypothetical protein
VATRGRDPERASELVTESHAVFARRGDRWGLAQTLGTLGAIARDEGSDDEAYELLSQSATLAREVGHEWWAGATLAELAALSLKAGRVDDAEAKARESLLVAHGQRNRAGRVFALGLLACVAAERGELERAGRLWGAIEHEDAGAPLGGWRWHRAACEARIRSAAGPEFERGSAAGRALSLDEAAEHALAGE